MFYNEICAAGQVNGFTECCFNLFGNTKIVEDRQAVVIIWNNLCLIRGDALDISFASANMLCRSLQCGWNPHWADHGACWLFSPARSGSLPGLLHPSDSAESFSRWQPGGADLHAAQQCLPSALFLQSPKINFGLTASIILCSLFLSSDEWMFSLKQQWYH